jgi:hypothetical protein
MNGVYGEQVGIQVVQSTGQPYTYGGQKPHDVAPLTQAYLDSIKKFAPNSADTDTLESIWTQTFWVAVQALTKAIDTQTSAITWKGVNQWFASQKNYQSGLTSPINFDPKCKTGSGVWLYQWKWNQAHNRFEQTPWNEYGGPFTMPDSYLNKIVPGSATSPRRLTTSSEPCRPGCPSTGHPGSASAPGLCLRCQGICA